MAARAEPLPHPSEASIERPGVAPPSRFPSFDYAPEHLVIDAKLLFAILLLEAVALFIVRLPGTLSFNSFAFFDTGANLTAQYLITHGLRPAVDFSYFYGLLPLLFGRFWFGLFGLTPRACVALVPLMDIFIVWGLVRFAVNVRLNIGGVLLLCATGFLIIPSSFLNLTHGIEPIFIIYALADQAAGNRRRALALATFCVFVKPSMAFFLGFVLLVFILVEAARARGQFLLDVLHDTWPAALSGLCAALAIALAFGWPSLVRSLFPFEGAAEYRAQGFGLFNEAGRPFLFPVGVPWTYYLVNVAGPWALYTITLIAGSLVVITKALKLGLTHPASEVSEVIGICLFLHLSFIFLFFGNEFSWMLYFYILVLGLAALARHSKWWQIIVIVLALFLPLSKVGKALAAHLASRTQVVAASRRGSNRVAALPVEAGFTFQLWRSTQPSPEVGGLWVSRAEGAEWRKVLGMIRGHRAALLEYYGCGALLFPEFSPPVTVYLVPGSGQPGDVTGDIARKVTQLKSADMVVSPIWHLPGLRQIPSVRAVMRRDFRLKYEGANFAVFVHLPRKATN